MLRSRAAASLRASTSSLHRQDAIAVFARTFVAGARHLQQNRAKIASPEKSHESQLSPSTPQAREHNRVTVAVVKFIGRLLGYNNLSSKAIRVTSELYDRCAERADIEEEFWYKECGLPRTYQTWFQITNMHVHLLLTRFRALPASKAQAYSQELINHYFIDAESRMRVRFGVQTNRLVTGYMREMHAQQRGAVLGLDEALSYSISRETERERFGDADSALATALWRNLWGAGGWGTGVAGVKRKLRGIDKLSEEERAARKREGRQGAITEAELEGVPELAEDIGSESKVQGERSTSAKSDTAVDQLHFAVALNRLVHWYRRETARLANINDQHIETGWVRRASAVSHASGDAASQSAQGVADFSKI